MMGLSFSVVCGLYLLNPLLQINKLQCRHRMAVLSSMPLKICQGYTIIQILCSRTRADRGLGFVKYIFTLGVTDFIIPRVEPRMVSNTPYLFSLLPSFTGVTKTFLGGILGGYHPLVNIPFGFGLCLGMIIHEMGSVTTTALLPLLIHVVLVETSALLWWDQGKTFESKGAFHAFSFLLDCLFIWVPVLLGYETLFHPYSYTVVTISCAWLRRSDYTRVLYFKIAHGAAQMLNVMFAPKIVTLEPRHGKVGHRQVVHLSYGESCARIDLCEGLLTHEECDALIKAAEPRLKRDKSTAFGMYGEVIHFSNSRAEIARSDVSKLEALKVVEDKICDWLRIERGQIQQLLRVCNTQVGCSLLYHNDTTLFETEAERTRFREGRFPLDPENSLREQPDKLFCRCKTAIVYLNTCEGGGSTHFPWQGIDVPCVKGNAVFFEFIKDLDSVPTFYNCLHAGMPVWKGEKWLLNCLIYSQPYRDGYVLN